MIQLSFFLSIMGIFVNLIVDARVNILQNTFQK